MAEDLRPRVLVADDGEENRYVLSRVLGAAGYDCVETGIGRGALEIAQTLPDVMILDVNLPDISGYEVCRRIKHDLRTAFISLLQISASFISSEDRVRALEAGVDGYLTRPIDRRRGFRAARKVVYGYGAIAITGELRVSLFSLFTAR